MRLLTKAEACRELRLSLSTLNRRIAAGEVPVRREPRGRRHRVYVMLDDDPPSVIDSPPSKLIAAQKRIQDLEGQVELLQGQLAEERQRNAELVRELTAAQTTTAQERRGSWWRRFWQRNGNAPPTTP